MAVPEVESVDSVTFKLGALLDKARQAKLSTSIHPPLPVAEVFGEQNSFKLQGNPVLVKGVLEVAARNLFYDIVARTNIEEPEFVQMWNFLDILQYYEDHGQSSPALVLWLLEEMLDSQNIDGCRHVFDYMESRRETLIASNFDRNKDLVILRSCNELLRRLSRAEDAVFCGRVFIFMFLSFPLGDKSSVNPRGEFHVENVTTFEEVSVDVPVDVVDEMEVDAETDGQAAVTVKVQSEEDQVSGNITKKEEKNTQGASSPPKIDADALYPIFWSLQQAFSNPARLFTTESFEAFKKGMEMTLQKFKEVPTVISGDKLGVGKRQSNGSDDFASTFSPKYLTSRDLFRLELSDLAFQRHILVQALILIDFLLSLTERSKSKLPQPTTQKALQYPFTLSDTDAEWALGIKRSIINYLQEGPDGKFYHRMVEVVLSRDKNWVRWKLESCPEIKRAPASAEVFQEAKSGAQKACASRRLRAAPMGSLDLAFLSGQEGLKGTESLKDADRIAMPTPDSLIRGIEGDDLDLEMADGEEEKSRLEAAKDKKSWRALRISSRGKLSRFDQVEDGKKLQKLTEIEVVMDSSSVHDNNVHGNGEAPTISADGQSNNTTSDEQNGPGQIDVEEESRAGTSDQVMAIATEEKAN